VLCHASHKIVLKRELGEAAVIRAKDTWPVVFTKELQIG